MNQVILIGRITKDPEERFSQSGMAVCQFTLALDRGKDKNGNDKGADFPRCVAFGKTAETICRYIDKGRQMAIIGHIQTGSYEGKNGKVYTTDVVVDRMEFIGNSGRRGQGGQQTQPSDDWRAEPVHPTERPEPIPDRQEFFREAFDDVPF